MTDQEIAVTHTNVQFVTDKSLIAIKNQDTILHSLDEVKHEYKEFRLNYSQLDRLIRDMNITLSDDMRNKIDVACQLQQGVTDLVTRVNDMVGKIQNLQSRIDNTIRNATLLQTKYQSLHPQTT